MIIINWLKTYDVNYERTDLYVWERRILKQFKESGVYVFRDKNDNIIYIGEAENLAERVSNHLTGKADKSALYNHEGFIFTYKVELYRLQKADAHNRFIMEIDAIQRLNPIFNTKYRIDDTPQGIEEKRKDYIRTNEHITWKYWTLWQVKAYLEGEVLTDILIEKIRQELEDWDTIKTNVVIKMIKERLSYPTTDEVIKKVFLFGTGEITDKNQISPIKSIVLGFDTAFKRKFKEGTKSRILQMISEDNRKDVGEKLTPTTRTEGDIHTKSINQVFE